METITSFFSDSNGAALLSEITVSLQNCYSPFVIPHAEFGKAIHH